MKSKYQRQQERYLGSKRSAKEALLKELEKLKVEIESLDVKDLDRKITYAKGDVKALRKEIKAMRKTVRKLSAPRRKAEEKDRGKAGGSVFKMLCTMLGESTEVKAWLDRVLDETDFETYEQVLDAYIEWLGDPAEELYDDEEQTDRYGYTEEEWNAMGPKQRHNARKLYMAQPNHRKANKDKVHRSMENFIIAYRK